MWRTLVSEAHTLHTAIEQQMSSWHERPAGALYIARALPPEAAEEQMPCMHLILHCCEPATCLASTCMRLYNVLVHVESLRLPAVALQLNMLYKSAAVEYLTWSACQ